MVQLLVIPAIWLGSGCSPEPPPPDLSALSQTMVGLPGHPVGRLRLDTADGSAFDETQLIGRWTVVGLGYTSCPDVCPSTYLGVAHALDEIPALQALFVAIDPQRDRAHLAAWTQAFHPRIVGLTAEPPALRAAAQEIGASFEIHRDADGAPTRVDHSTSLFVVDPAGRVVAAHLRPSDGPLLADELAELVASHRPPQAFAHSWVRPPLPGSGVSAGYGRLVDHRGDDVTITEVYCPEATATHAHETVHDGDQAWMRPTTLVVPGDGELTLAPGGRHLMFSGLQPDVDAVHLRFTLADGTGWWSRVPVQADPT